LERRKVKANIIVWTNNTIALPKRQIFTESISSERVRVFSLGYPNTAVTFFQNKVVPEGAESSLLRLTHVVASSRVV
jgi:hypothetical protein